MSNASRWLTRAVLAAGLCTSVGAAHALKEFTILYTGSGTGTDQAGIVIGKANDWVGMTSPIPGEWDVWRHEIYDFQTRSMHGEFRFTDTLGNNNLWGRFVGGWEPYFVPNATGTRDASHIRTFNNFVIEGGTGIFEGATGRGEDRVYTNFALSKYVESGILQVTAMPEPSTTLMIFAGAMALTAWRRRQANRT